MIEIPFSRASVVEEKATRSPSSSMNPDVGVTTPEESHQRRLAGAVLSSSAVTLPRRMSKFTPLRAWVPPKFLAMLRAASTISAAGGSTGDAVVTHVRPHRGDQPIVRIAQLEDADDGNGFSGERGGVDLGQISFFASLFRADPTF